MRSNFTRAAAVTILLWPALAAAQTPPKPLPFPRPGETTPPAEVVAQQPPAPIGPGEPTEAALGVPLYPAATFLGSFDAGMNQRVYLYGTNAGYVEIVNYYKNVLRERGRELFRGPVMHLFEIGRFRKESMAVPMGVVVKDFTWGGREGFTHVNGAAVETYRTVIQVVPVVPER